jgi:uncharacterized protein
LQPGLLDLALLAAGFFAGLVDAMVGGGGLIQVPALVGLFPFAAPASIMGTSKFAGVFGTFAAFIQYARRINLPKRALLIASLTAGVGAMTGAWLLTQISKKQFDLLLPVLLSGIFVYTLVRKDLGQNHAPRFSGGKLTAASAATGATLGLYDGFFGPGTGSFLVFIYVRIFGFDFLHASAMAKGVNVACNAFALVFFISFGHLLWPQAVWLAVANLAGGIAGSHLALRYGSVWMRRVFMVVVAGLILNMLRKFFLPS